ncbi:SecDF P1 head subdomain-containing protein [Pengzhenrongella phosphoraccumulans]|uniref:SecDF P1 head subdomain-containing protein n=1 Tax=Pengzhenrongella phosphoraccumulans TaxID=3114394 RepID=UPI00388FD081
MTHDDDFSRDLLARADAVAPTITVDTTRVISNARRRRAMARTAGALALTVVLGGSGWALNEQIWQSASVAPAGHSQLRVAGEDDPTPQVASDTLGLSLTITPTSSTGAGVPVGALPGAVALTEQRLSSAGITDARVSDNGDGTIGVELVTKLDQRVVDLVGRPVELAIRPVLAAGAPGPGDGGGDTPAAKGAPDSPSDLAYYATADVLAAYAQLDCTLATSRTVKHAATDSALVACDATGTEKYILGPVEVPGTTMGVPLPQDPQAQSVRLQFATAGTAAFGEMTARIQGLTSPQNRVAMVLDGVVITAPTLAPGTILTNGEFQISGDASGSDATNLTGELALGALAATFQIANAGATG